MYYFFLNYINLHVTYKNGNVCKAHNRVTFTPYYTFFSSLYENAQPFERLPSLTENGIISLIILFGWLSPIKPGNDKIGNTVQCSNLLVFLPSYI